MDKIELLQKLLEKNMNLNYDNKEKYLNELTESTELLIRNFFGDSSHYLTKLQKIVFYPLVSSQSSIDG